jgi:hypothetical protein
MSWQPANDPKPGDRLSCDAIETVIVPRSRDLGSFEVRRALPSSQRQLVGPFIFFDQMGPAEFLLGAGMDVRPHPHIGLSTVTYLFDGEIMHRDSLGTVLAIRPGELNWMTAGRGIAHSERTPPELRTGGSKLFGIQSWVALSRRDEENAPGRSALGSPRFACPPLVFGAFRIGSFRPPSLQCATPILGIARSCHLRSHLLPDSSRVGISRDRFAIDYPWKIMKHSPPL